MNKYLVKKSEELTVQSINPDKAMKEIADAKQLSDVSPVIKSYLDPKLSETHLKLFKLAQAKRELQKVIKYNELLDKVEEEFEKRIITSLDTLPDFQLQKTIEMMMKSIDRSNALVSDVIKDPNLLNLFVVDNSKNLTVNTTASSESGEVKTSLNVEDPASRRRIADAVTQVLAQIQSAEQNIEKENNNYE